MISDVGRCYISELQDEFPYVDFTSCYQTPTKLMDPNNDNNDKSNINDDHCWWWQPNPKSLPYVEWRPTGQNQRYACPGEPQHEFDKRMTKLYYQLQEFLEPQQEQQSQSQPSSLSLQRQEQQYCNIVVVCHHGVIDWMLNQDFENCEYRQVDWKQFQPQRLLIRQ